MNRDRKRAAYSDFLTLESKRNASRGVVKCNSLKEITKADLDRCFWLEGLLFMDDR